MSSDPSFSLSPRTRTDWGTHLERPLPSEGTQPRVSAPFLGPSPKSLPKPKSYKSSPPSRHPTHLTSGGPWWPGQGAAGQLIPEAGHASVRKGTKSSVLKGLNELLLQSKLLGLVFSHGGLYGQDPSVLIPRRMTVVRYRINNGLWLLCEIFTRVRGTLSRNLVPQVTPAGQVALGLLQHHQQGHREPLVEKPATGLQ